MTRRPGEWHLLDVDRDPVPASSSEVHKHARQFRDLATDLEDARSTIQSLNKVDSWVGDAADTFGDKAQDHLKDVDKTVTRYAEAADALESYVTAVSVARTDSKTALNTAVDADARRRDNQPSDVAIDTEDDAAVTAEENRVERLERAESDLADAKTALQEALDILENAASRCASAIRKTSDNFKDHRFKDDILRKGADKVKALLTVLEVIGVILAVVTLVVVICFTAPAWLIAAGIAVAVLTLGAVAWLYFADNNSKDLGDVSWAVGGLALAGGGAFVAKWTKSAVGAARSTLVEKITTQALSRTSKLTQLGHRIRHTRVFFLPVHRWPLLGWVGRKGQAVVDDALSVINRADEAIPPVTTWDKISHLDGRAASWNRELRVLRDAAKEADIDGQSLAAIETQISEATRHLNTLRATNVADAVATGTDVVDQTKNLVTNGFASSQAGR